MKPNFDILSFLFPTDCDLNLFKLIKHLPNLYYKSVGLNAVTEAAGTPSFAAHLKMGIQHS